MFGKKQPDMDKMDDSMIQKRIAEIDTTLNELNRMGISKSLPQIADNLGSATKAEMDRVKSVKASSPMSTRTVRTLEQVSKMAAQQREMMNNHNQGLAKMRQGLLDEKQVLMNEVTRRSSIKFKAVSADLGFNKTDGQTGDLRINSY